MDFLLRGGRLTKVAGAVASFAPSVGRSAPLAGASALALGIGFGCAALTALTASQALAACSVVSGVTYCTGATTDAVSTTNKIVLGTGTASVVYTQSSTSPAINMTRTSSGWSSPQELTQSGTGTIYGNGTSISHSTNNDYGGVSITVLGTVKGTNGVGISVKKGKNGYAVIIKAVDVSGYREGINVDAASRGNLWTSITSTGTVTSQTRSGIHFTSNRNRDDSTAGVTVTAHNVSGAEHGIYITNGNTSTSTDNRYEGSVSVTVTGRVTGGTSHSAIDVRSQSLQKYVKIDIASGAIVGTGGEQFAIRTRNGRLKATVKGTVHGKLESNSGGWDQIAFNPNSRGTLTTVSGIDVMTIESGAMVKVGGSGTSVNKLTLESGGTLDVAHGNVIGSTTVGGGNFFGGGTIILGADFSGSGTPKADRLEINGDVSGTTTLDISPTGTGATGEFLVVHVGPLDSNNNYTVNANSFVAGPGYTLRYDASNKKFYASVATATDSCEETSTGSGVFRCTGTITGVASISASGTTTVDAEVGAQTQMTSSTSGLHIQQTGGTGGVTLVTRPTSTVTVTSGATARSGIHVVNRNGGAISVNSQGTVTGGTDSNGFGLRAQDFEGDGVTITAAGSVSGRTAIGAYAMHSSDFSVSVTTTGTVTGGLYGIAADAGGNISGTIDIDVQSGAVTAGTSSYQNAAGIEAVSRTALRGSVSITVGSAATVSGDNGIVVETGAGATTDINVLGTVIGQRKDGIRVSQSGVGKAIRITVSGRVQGGTSASGHAIELATPVPQTVPVITLNSGAQIVAGGGEAIKSGTATRVVVNTGASVTGKIDLLGGDDRVELSGGSLSGEFDAGAGDDTLAVTGGTVTGTLTGGEGADTLRVASGSISGALSGWETVTVESGGRANVLGSAAATTLTVSGTLDLSDGEIGDFTTSGDFTGGGTITLDADLSNSAPSADKIVISGSVSGTATINVSSTGSVATGEFLVVDAGDSSAVTAGNFVAGRGYSIRFDAPNKRFYAMTKIGCEETSSGSGVFECSGAMTATRTLSASGNTSLSVSLAQNAGVAATSGNAFDLSSSAGISFEQSGTGTISARDGGIMAQNAQSGSIAIRTRGKVTATGGRDQDDKAAAIAATNTGTQTGDITITAADVQSWRGPAIVAVNNGTGAVRIHVAGSATAIGQQDYPLSDQSGAAIYANTGAAATDLSISVVRKAGAPADSPSVTVLPRSGEAAGLDHAVRAKHYGSGSLTISAEGALRGAATGISISGSSSGSIGINVPDGIVASSDGIRIMQSPTQGRVLTGALTISAGDLIGAGNGKFKRTNSNAAMLLQTSGAIDVTISGHVDRAGGDHPSDKKYGIWIRSAAGKAVKITLESGAEIDGTGGQAIVDTEGNAAVTVNTGAWLEGAIKLGSGADGVTVSGGSIRGSVDLGSGDDRLNISGGGNVEGAVDGGAGDDDITVSGTGGTLSGTPTDFRNLTIESGATLKLAGAATFSGRIDLSGTLDLSGDGAMSTISANTIENAADAMLIVDADFSQQTADMLDEIENSNQLVIDVNVIAAKRGNEVTLFRTTGSTGSLNAVLAGDKTSLFSIRRSSFFVLLRQDAFLGKCDSTPSGSGVFECAGELGAQAPSVAAGTKLDFRLNDGTVDADGTDSAVTLIQSGAGGIVMTQSATAGAIKSTGGTGIVARNTGGGGVSIDVKGSVTSLGGTANAGIRVSNDSSGGAVTVSAAGGVSAHGGAIDVVSSGTGGVNVTAQDLTSLSGTGVNVMDSGTGSIDIALSGTVTGGSGGVQVSTPNDVEIRSTGTVAGSGASANGIYAKQTGASTTQVTVSGPVSTSSTDSARAAIKARVYDGANNPNGLQPVTITLECGAAVSAATAISVASFANATVTVNSGATTSGKIEMAGGADTLAVAGGSVSSDVNLGAGDDTLAVTGGTVTGTLAGGDGTDTLRVAGGAVNGAISDWETVTVQSGGQMNVLGSAAATTLTVAGTLNLNDGAIGSFSTSGDFIGGGEVILDANFADGTADTLEIGGSATGVTTISIAISGFGSNSAVEIVEVAGQVSGSAFALSEMAKQEYTLSNAGGTFTLALRPEGSCALSSGVYTCTGPIHTPQVMRGSSTDLLSVAMASGAVVNIPSAAAAPGHGFDLSTDTNSGNSIAFTQSGSDAFIIGRGTGIHAQINRYGGHNVSITTEGMVTGRGGHGIFANSKRQNGNVTVRASGTVIGSGADSAGIHAELGHASGGTLVQIAAADVRGAKHGIYAKISNSGNSDITVSGSVSGGSGGAGIYVNSNHHAHTHTLTLESGARVSGGSRGIRTLHGQAVLHATNAAISGGISLGSNGTGNSSVTLVDTDVSGGLLTSSGNDTVSIQGGSISGDISLRAGADTATISGTTVTGAVNLGEGDDTLAINGGRIAGTAAGGDGDDTVNVSGSGSVDGLTGFKDLNIASGATLKLAGSASFAGAINLSGTLDLSGDDAFSTISAAGMSNGSGATVVLDANFATEMADSLREFVPAGRLSIDVNVIAEGVGKEVRILRVDSTATAPDVVIVGQNASRFSIRTNSFDVMLTQQQPLDGCRETASGSGIFRCDTAIASAQTLSASGSTALAVSISSNASIVTTAGTALQLSSDSGISLTQSGPGEIKGASAGIHAVSSGGSISINVTGSVAATGTAAGNRAIYAKTATGDLTISAADVSGSGIGIEAVNEGTGAISVAVSGSVAGSAASIQTKSRTNGAVTVALNSGAVVNSGIVDEAGNATVTVNSGASVARQVVAGDGTDALIVRSGGSVGSSSAAASASGWESITVESGAAATLSMAAGTAAMTQMTLAGELNVADGAHTTLDVSGGFAGGGLLVIDVNFAGNSGDKIDVAGAITGTTRIQVRPSGGLSANSFAFAVAGTSQQSVFTLQDGGSYTLEYDSATRTHSIKSKAYTPCAETGSGSGAFVCSGDDGGRRTGSQSLSASGGVALSVTLNSETGIDAVGSAFVLTQTGGAGGIALTQSAGGKAIKGTASAIIASNTGGGAIAIDVNGAVTGAGGDGIRAVTDASGAGITITAASVAGEATGIRVGAAGSGRVSISASGVVAGADDGIFVDRDGSGATSIAVSSAVTGGSGTNVAAIRTDVSSGSDVTVLLGSGASVGEGEANAILGSAGDTAVTVNAGAAIAGKVKLGAGSDALTFAGGAFSAVTEMDGGDGSGDTLTFRAGSGSLHATVVSEGLKGWESVVVESGATVSGNIKLADDSGNLTLDGATLGNSTLLEGGGGSANALTLRNMSGSVNRANLTGWETIGIAAGSSITFGTSSVSVDTLSVSAGGTLDAGNDSDTTDALTISGNFSGGGAVALNVNFAPGSIANDTLTINGNATGTTTLSIGRIAETGSIPFANRVLAITGVIAVTGTVSANAFVAGGDVIFGPIGYRLKFNQGSGGTASTFDLERYYTNECEAVVGRPGAFTCSGANQIGESQSLSASGATALSVTLNAETEVDTNATALALTQTGGRGGIAFTQSGGGRQIRGADSGIVATNTGGGAISIRVNGTVIGANGDGIRATSDASGAGIAISAAGVSGSTAGIRVIAAGAGSVSVSASGSVTGAAGDGIVVEHGGRGATSIAVSGGVTGGGVAGKAAIRTDSAGGTAVIVLARGAAARASGNGAAIIDGGAAATVTVQTGAAIQGGVSLGAGADELVLAGGDFSGITAIDGGEGADTLRVTAGSGTLAPLSDGTGVRNIERVVVSGSAMLVGDVRLGAETAELVFADGAEIGGAGRLVGVDDARLALRGVNGRLDLTRLSNWKALEIGAGSRVALDGPLGRAAADSLAVTGTMAIGSGTQPGDTLTVEGGFSGGGQVEIDANFANGKSDRLVVGGDVSGATSIVINNRTPQGAAPSGGDLEVVTVGDEADASAFRLLGDGVPFGAFSYDLLSDNGAFVLRPGDRVSDTGAVLRSAPAAIAVGFARASALSARTAARAPAAAVGSGIGLAETYSERGFAPAGQGAASLASTEARSVWARFYSDKREFGADAISGAAEIDSSGMQFGMDILTSEAQAGKWVAGLTAQYGSVNAKSTGSGGVGTLESSGYGVGATLSWFGYSGFYADAQAQLGTVESDYSSNTMGVIKSGVSAGTALAALEAGWRMAMGERTTLVPQGQISMSSVNSDGFVSGDMDVRPAITTAVEGRIGLAAEYALSRGAIRVSGSLHRSLSDANGLIVDDKTINQGLPDGWMEFGIGGSLDVSDDAVIFFDGTWSAGDGRDDASGASLSGGFKFNW